MAKGISKNSITHRGTSSVPDKVRIKRVKKAGCWCRTEFIGGKQKQSWHAERPHE